MLNDIEIARKKREQKELAEKVIVDDCFGEVPKIIGGMDITFLDIHKNPTKAWASIVCMDIDSLDVLHTDIAEGTIEFPYVPGLLAYRELPLLLELYKRVKHSKYKPDIFFIDGHGRSHPRRSGIACHFGVETGEMSVGIAKKLLCGKHEPVQDVLAWNEYIRDKEGVIGAVYVSKPGEDPIYVSVGHKMTLEGAMVYVSTMIKTGERLPEPTRIAHNILQPVRREAVEHQTKR